LEQLKEILEKFQPITLKEMDKAKLMDRTDTKFTFTQGELAAILEEVKDKYKVLEIEKHRMSTYQTLYYDTADLSLYTHHHNGKLNRYKVRHRSYVESNIGFLEVKFKNNKGRTIKDRIKKAEVSSKWCEESSGFLTKKTPFDPKGLVPVVWVNYKRITLVNNANAERVTIDTDLEFVNNGITKKMHNLVIAEVKQDKKSKSDFLGLMKKYHIRVGSISKYCMAIVMTRPSVKKNNFKEKLGSLKHILYAGHNTLTNS
jgi:hypothetical protein